MKNDRFLLGILAFIAVIVIAAFALFFLRGADQTYLPEDTPESVVHNYTLALTQGDYLRAYGYLAENSDKPTLADFRGRFTQFDPVQDVGLRIGETEILGDQAVVEVTVLYASSGPFDSGYSSGESALLELQDGVWKITLMPYPFWEFGWYEEK